MDQFIAHRNLFIQKDQTILEHLVGTANRAKDFAEQFGAGKSAYKCGMAHDIGKYSEGFQERIRGKNNQVDHSTAGAKEVWEQGEDIISAFCIAGHHAGLPDFGNRKIDTVASSTLWGRLKREVGAQIENYETFHNEVTIPDAQIPEQFKGTSDDLFFFIKMLYSCLVDADFLDTESFMTDYQVMRGQYNNLQELKNRFNKYIDQWKNPQTELDKRRCQILKRLLDRGQSEKGLFSLTVPTGGGKTVASMAFALNHALRWGMSRIIYVIPYTSIIEQTQLVFEKIFGEENVVAHYANVEYSHSENQQDIDKRYLATENWDAPIIVTTSVQFFESIYANRSSRSRKIHNIVNSVLIFDEAQMLPVQYLQPCVLAISELVKQYRCSAVLCTATQPALNRLFQRFAPEQQILELSPNQMQNDPVFKRVNFCHIGKVNEEILVEKLNAEKQVLCIVNNRKQAQRIYHKLGREGNYHLSTMMFPAHRRKVLEEVREQLQKGESCRVISTSLVEAGVDVDFPVVYRAMAGLDSIIQAGGRCNREGKRPFEDSYVYVFDSEGKIPKDLKKNIASAERVMQNTKDFHSSESIQNYFEFLYYTLKDEDELDQKQILKKMREYAFKSIGETFRLIENNTYTIYIPNRENKHLIFRLRQREATRDVLRKLGQYSVSVFEKEFEILKELNAIEVISDNSAILIHDNLYNEQIGLELCFEGGQGIIT